MRNNHVKIDADISVLTIKGFGLDFWKYGISIKQNQVVNLSHSACYLEEKLLKGAEHM